VRAGLCKYEDAVFPGKLGLEHFEEMNEILDVFEENEARMRAAADRARP
jgi:hypothetical protein